MSDHYEERRLSFGAVAEEYDAIRPSWPEPPLRWLSGDPAPGARVLDLGAGTGKGTRTLAAMGLDVVAVDPSEGMLDVLRGWLPHAAMLVGSAEAIPLPDHAVDAVVVLQAWHWFDPARAAAECARVLRPGGTLGLAWHVPNPDDPLSPWVAEVEARTQSPRDNDDEGPPVVGAGFGPVEQTAFTFDLELTVDELVTLASSWSYVRLAPDREERLAQVRAIGEGAARDGVVRYPHRTECYRFRAHG